MNERAYCCNRYSKFIILLQHWLCPLSHSKNFKKTNNEHFARFLKELLLNSNIFLINRILIIVSFYLQYISASSFLKIFICFFVVLAMSEDAAVGKTVTVYDESLDESCKGVIDDYYPGRGYRKFLLIVYTIACLLSKIVNKYCNSYVFLRCSVL